VVVWSMLRRRRYAAAGGTARTTSPIPLSPGSHAALRFESHSILGMRIQSHWLPTTGQYLAYQRDTYTNVTGRDLQLEAGRTTSLFKTMTETLNLARTNIASGVKEDDLKPIQRPAKRTVVRRTSPRRTCTTRP